MAKRPLLSNEEKLRRRKNSLAKYYAKNREKHCKYMREYNQRDYVKTKLQQFKKENSDKNSVYQANYQAAKANRTVLWDTELTDFVVEEAHHLRGLRDNFFSFTWDVDHIIPLRGRVVSGLHVWNNLQVVPSSYNRSKGNKYDL